MKHLIRMALAPLGIAACMAASALMAGHAQAQPAPSQNPIAEYYGEKGYPIWTDAIRWGNRINMATYSNGANDFEKFENARDELFNQGGGVLYYPSGTYNFANHPTGPNGRGLMLKAGVVILGDAPTADANAVVDSVTPGLTQLGTRFLFPFMQMPRLGGGFGQVPDSWNMIGLYADANTRISADTNVGIAWVNLVGAYVYFGPDMPWAPTWNDVPNSFRRPRQAVNSWQQEAWATRIPRGDFPGDPFIAAPLNTSHIPSGKRFVFGCRLDHSAVTNDFTVDYVTQTTGGVTTRIDSTQEDAYHTYRFAARITCEGHDGFVANNVISRSDRNFYYDQKIRRHGMVVAGQPRQVMTIMYDFGKQAGIDMNKQLISQRFDRCDYRIGPMVSPNVIARDNWVYSHGHKGYELAGKWMLIKDNYNQRDFLQQGADVYNIGQVGWRLTLDGWSESGPNSDNLSRAYDLAGWNSWVDGNWFQGTGSNPGNDGEGILFQPQGGVGFFSFAETNNRNGLTGKDGYIAPYDVPVYGMLQFKNRTRGAVGVVKGDNNRIEDAYAVDNVSAVTGQPVTARCAGCLNIADFSPNCPTAAPTAPDSFRVEPNLDKYHIRIRWRDQTTNEIGFKIERAQIVGGQQGNWVTVAYRPANVTGSIVDNLSVLDNGNVPPGCANQGWFNLNPQEWWDYLGVPGGQYIYRVLAIDCNDGAIASTPNSPIVTFPQVPTRVARGAALETRLMPNPTGRGQAARLLLPGTGTGVGTVTMYDASGRVVLRQPIAGSQSEVSLQTGGLSAGLYQVRVVTSRGQSLHNLVIE